MTEIRPHSNSRVGCWNRPAPNRTAQARRDKRIVNGEEERVAERTAWPGRRVTHSELMLPLLQLLVEAGHARPADLYDELVARLDLGGEVRSATRTYGEQETVVFDRTVRWALQEGKRQGLMQAPERGRWRATNVGADMLGRVRPGMILTVFRTALGQAVAARAEEAASVIDPKSLQLMFTSPLFPSIQKEYGSMSPAEWLPWYIELVAGCLPLMADDGVLAFHLGQVHYRGTCAVSSYRERFVLALQDDLGLYQQQPFFWEQPTRKGTMEWTAVRKMLPHNTVDPIYLFSKASQPKLDVGAMKLPYADPNDPRLSAPGGKERRPSGLDFGPNSFRDRGGSLVGNVIQTGPVGGNDPWRRALKEAGIAAHPCPMPVPVPARIIQATTSPGQKVGDIMSGSGAVGAAAEMLGREWIALDHHRYYLDGAALRPEYRNAPGYRLCSA